MTRPIQPGGPLGQERYPAQSVAIETPEHHLPGPAAPPKPARPPSIRQHMVLTLIVTLGLTWCTVTAIGFFEARHETAKIFDNQLAQTAHTLFIIARHEMSEKYLDPLFTVKQITDDLLPGTGYPYDYRVAFVAWDLDGKPLFYSKSAASLLKITATEGFSNQSVGDQQWRFYVLSEPDLNLRILVGHRYQVRDDIALKVAKNQILPLLLALPLLVVLVWFAVGRGLAPLRHLSEVLRARRPDELHPVTTPMVPKEVRPLTLAIDDLLRRIHKIVEGERRFTADAAHELRTPLAGLKTQAQVALRAQSPEQRDQALRGLEAGVDNMAHLVNQLLTLARLEPQNRDLTLEPVDLCKLVTEIVGHLAPGAIDKGLDLGVDCTEPVLVQGQAGALDILVGNLINNALRYTPSGGSVDIGLTRTDNGVRLWVRDTGPGIPPQDLDRICQRFYRAQNTTAPGSGLGLSIVQRIVELHGAKLRLRNLEPQGLEAVVNFEF